MRPSGLLSQTSPGRSILGWLGERSAGRDPEDLRRAERLVQKLRWLAILSWLALFPWTPTWADSSATILAVFAATLVYAAICQVVVHRVEAVQVVSALTTTADTVAVAAIVSVTGGLASPILHVFMLTVLSTAIRSGMAEAFAIATLDAIHVGVIAIAVDGSITSAAIAEELYLLYFAALFSGLLSREARDQSARAKQERNRANELLRRVLEVDEIERRRIAGELHDQMGKRFLDLTYDLRRCRDAVGQDPAIREYLDRLDAHVRDGAKEVRSLTNELRPSVLDDFGFVEALKEFILATQDRAEFEISLAIEAALPRLSPGVELALLRVLQEAVTNVRKHAAARKLRVELAAVAGGRHLRLSVGDDGIGFDPARSNPGHYGLLYMRERVQACGGWLAIRRGQGGGTVVEATVPVSS